MLTLFSLLLVAAPAEAKDSGQRGIRTLAVQNRVHSQRHEYTFAVGALPVDAFTKGYTGTGAYTLHFSDLLAWEVVQFTYSLQVDTRLNDQLNNLPQPIGPTPFEVVDYYGTSSLVLKPVYGKFALLNRSLIYTEGYLALGGGYGKLSITSRPALNLGAGLRVWTGRKVSFRLDVRNYSFLQAAFGDWENEVWIGLGISLGLGSVR